MAKVSSALLKRRLDIAEIVRKKGEIKVEELSYMLQVSTVTIRQDLTYLEQQGYLKRSFGGAIYLSPEGTNNKTHIVAANNSLPVDDIYDIDLVKNCLNYINDGDTIFLSHGRLTRKLIPYLHVKKSLKLIMNDINNAQLAKEFTDANVVLTGGVLLKNNILHNDICDSILDDYSISHFIVELTAINHDNQIIIEDTEQISIYQQLIKKAHHIIGILPQRVVYNDDHSIGKLKNMDVMILSRPAVTEYHQQLLDSSFKQFAANKFSVIYQNEIGA